MTFLCFQCYNYFHNKYFYIKLVQYNVTNDVNQDVQCIAK